MNRDFSRRTVVVAAVCTATCLPSLPGAAAPLAAPFVSERITVRVMGSGPDVVLVPGLNSSPRVWASTVAAVPGYRYHLVQVSGFAGQAVGGNKEGDVAAPVAEEIARYLAESGVKRPAVIGHSLGGSIGLMLAARHPDALSRLMVVDMVPYLGAMFAGPAAPPAQVATMADRFVAGIRDTPPELRPKVAADTIDSMVNNVAMRPGAIDDMLASDVDVGARAFHELIVTNLGPELGRITVPVTVLYVQPTAVPLPPAQFDAVYQGAYGALRQVTVKRIPDSAHFIMWDQPQRFQQEVTAFLTLP